MFVEAVDLTGGHGECDAGAAFLVALISAVQNRQVQGGTAILGDLSVQGNLKALNSIQEPLPLAPDNGALRVLLPIGNKNQFGGLPEEVVGKLDIVSS